MALFLVDPHLKTISTANVPCQQKAWWAEQVRGIGPLGQMPPEMADHVTSVRKISNSTTLSKHS